MKIKISALAIQYLKEALCNIYWYKNDLKSFLLNCISDKPIIHKVDWSNYKRQIVSDIIDELMKDQERNIGDIRRILYEVTHMTNFRHLEQIEDGKRKAERAKVSVYELKVIIEEHDSQLRKEAVINKKRIENMEKIKSSQALSARLDEIKQIYSKLVISKNHHRRGFELEKILYNIFELFDLDQGLLSVM